MISTKRRVFAKYIKKDEPPTDPGEVHNFNGNFAHNTNLETEDANICSSLDWGAGGYLGEEVHLGQNHYDWIRNTEIGSFPLNRIGLYSDSSMTQLVTSTQGRWYIFGSISPVPGDKERFWTNPDGYIMKKVVCP